MKRSVEIAIFLMTVAWMDLHAQSSLSFIHLETSTFQNRFINPAYVPKGKLFIGLPLLSGLHLNYNNRINYREIIVNRKLHDEIDLNSFLRRLKKNNMVSISSDLSLFHVAVTTESGLNVAFFANERMRMDFLYPRSFMEFLIKGNEKLAGEQLRLGKTRFSSVYYREYGLGLTGKAPSGNTALGINIKYLQGFLNMSTRENFKADLEFDPVDYSVKLKMKNAAFRTAGLAIMQGREGNLEDHLLKSTNRGAAIDIGFNSQISNSHSIAASLTDLGFIIWQRDIKNHQLEDTSMYYDGLNLNESVRSDVKLEQAFKDSVVNKFKDMKTENTSKYTSMLPPKMYLTWTYHLAPTGDLKGSIGTRYIQGQMKLLFGAGYTHKFGDLLTANINVTRLPQQFLNLGGAFVLNAGAAQLYFAMDQITNFDVTRIRSADFRVGVNFVFRKNHLSGQKGGVRSSGSFLGSQVPVKGREAIYTIIEKQKRRKRADFIGEMYAH